MIYLLSTSMAMLSLMWIVPKKLIWTFSMTTSLMTACTATMLMTKNMSTTWHKMSPKLATDQVSTPLMMLSMWLTPLALKASIKTIKKKSKKEQRTFMSIMMLITIALILTFSATELTLFYMAFETTLLPTLTLMARWGSQKERMQASMYFLFYTLSGSLPLLIAMISMSSKMKTTSLLPLTIMKNLPKFPLTTTSLWWAFCLMAFMMKMPMYGLHLWLPKAHVEAPMAGSMMLAAMLLKLGGYGLMRTMKIFLIPSSHSMSYPLIIMCTWGALMTSMMCLRQTDLKALMAYSSVGHMSLVASGMLSLSILGTKGALVLMMAHGLISSALFCLAKMKYERKKTRTLSMTRGFSLMSPSLTMWWLMTCASNLGLPPSPKLIGELFIMSSMMKWNKLSIPMMTTSTMFSAMYSLLMFKKTKKTTFPKFLSKIPPKNSREHTLISLHLIPLLLMILGPKKMMMK